jgi:pimeloyl-ACP methyl ester carboxylesterase
VDLSSNGATHGDLERISVRGVELAIRTSGQGPAFIWGHGLLTSMAQEDAVGVFDRLRTLDEMRCIRYDARGHGESEATYDPADYRWPALARDLLELSTRLGEPRALFGGVSMGCATSLYAAHLSPERVAGLLLVAPPAAWQTRPRQALVYRVAAGVVGYAGLGPFRWLTGLPALFHKDSVVTRMQRALIEHLARADERAVVAALTGAAQSDLPDPEALRSLDIPALILAWRGDPVHPVSTAQRLAEVMPRAEIAVAQGLHDLRDWPDRFRAFRERIHRGE